MHLFLSPCSLALYAAGFQQAYNFNETFFRLLAFTPALAGILLQGYTAFVMPKGYSDLSLAIFLYSCLPYAICWTIAALVNPLAEFFGALAALIDDMIVFHDVFIAPTHSTAPISLLFAPMSNLILLVPVGLFIGWCVDRGSAPTAHADRPSELSTTMLG